MTKSINTKMRDHIKPVLLVLLISIAGMIVNFFPIPIFANISLILGNTAFIIVAMRFGVIYSLLSAFIVSIGLSYSLGHPFVFILFGLEAVFVSIFYKRGWYALNADLVYWFFIGIPLTAILLVCFSELPVQLWLLTIVKQGFNGLVYACLSGIFVCFFPKLFDFSCRQQPRFERSLRVKMVYYSSLIISFSVISTSLIISQNVLSNLNQIIETNLIEKKEQLVAYGNALVSKDQSALTNYIKASQGSLSLQSSVINDSLYQLNSGLLYYNAIRISDLEGNIIASSNYSALSSDPVNHSEENIKNKPYLQPSLAANDFYISLTEKVINNEMVPVVLFNKRFDKSFIQKQSGILQAELSLHLFNETFPHNQSNHVKFLVTDKHDNVLVNTSTLPLKAFESFEYHYERGLSNEQTRLIRIDNINESYNTDFFHSVGTLQNGWRIHLLLNSSQVISLLEKGYISIFILMFITYIISLLLINKLGKQLSGPLQFINQQISDNNLSSQKELKPLPSDASSDVVLLYRELCRNKKVIDKHQFELEEMVEQRTNELRLANAKLTTLAEKDALTQVYNRGFFDKQFNFYQKLAVRNNNNVAVILLDLDYFKSINDHHGHLVGDQCLIAVAKLFTKQFSRETDLVARYGGEEFVMLITGINYANLFRKLEQIREGVSNIVVDTSNDKTIRMTISIGAIIAPANYAIDVKEWVKKADTKLYQAKGTGRNKVLIDNYIVENCTEEV